MHHPYVLLLHTTYLVIAFSPTTAFTCITGLYARGPPLRAECSRRLQSRSPKDTFASVAAGLGSMCVTGILLNDAAEEVEHKEDDDGDGRRVKKEPFAGS